MNTRARTTFILFVFLAVIGCAISDPNDPELLSVETHIVLDTVERLEGIDSSIHLERIPTNISETIILERRHSHNLQVEFVNSTGKPFVFIGIPADYLEKGGYPVILGLRADLYKNGKWVPRHVIPYGIRRLPDFIQTLRPGENFIHRDALSYYMLPYLDPGQYQLRIQYGCPGELLVDNETGAEARPTRMYLEKWVNVILK